MVMVHVLQGVVCQLHDAWRMCYRGYIVYQLLAHGAWGICVVCLCVLCVYLSHLLQCSEHSIMLIPSMML